MTGARANQPLSQARPERARLLMVPLDGSDLAELAIPVAGTLAHRTGAKLHLVSVFQPMPVLADDEELTVNPGLNQDLREQVFEYLKGTAEALGTTHGVETTYSVLDGAPVQALAEHARAKRVEAVVMTTHGHGGMNRFWLGSVADRLVRRVKVPVLLLRPRKDALQNEFHHIVVALDGLPEGERVLDPAMELGSLTREAWMTLVQVVEPPIALITRMALQPAHMAPGWRDLREDSARSYLDQMAERVRNRGLHVGTEMITARGVGEQILGLAQRVGADLIVVGTHGARGIERMLLGSVADKVIRGASQAVLVVPTERESE